MTPESDFAVPDHLFVPPELRHKITQILRSATRIVVSEKREDGGADKLNALRLRCQMGQLPSEPIDEIVDAVTAIIHNAWADQATEDEDGLPPLDVVVVAEHYETVKGKKTRIRTQFEFTYKGDDSSLYDAFGEEGLSLEDRSIMRAFDVLERQNNQFMGYIDVLQNMFIKLVEQQANAMAGLGTAASETMKHGMPMFFGGIQAMMNARSLEYSHHKAEAESKATTARISAALEHLAPFLGIGLSQLVANKLGVPPEFVSQMMGGMGRGQAPRGPAGGDAPPNGTPSNGAPRNGAHARAHEGEVDPEVDGDDVPAELVAFFASELGRVLTHAQRREIRTSFTKAEALALDDLFCSTTDAEAMNAYQTVVSKAGQKLVTFQNMLDPTQREVLSAFFNAVRQRMEADAASPPA